MIRRKTYVIALCTIFLSLILSSCEKKNYNVDIQDGLIHVTMHSPTMGIVGINQVGYDGFTYEEVEQEIFNKIRNRSYDGSYNVSVTLQFIDSYGNYYNGDNVMVSTLSASEVKKYASYGYFKGQSHIEKAFPWNHNYGETKNIPHNNMSTYSNNDSSKDLPQSPSKQEFDFTGSWECPNPFDSDMNISLTIIHNTSNNMVSIDYLVNVRLYTFDNASGWVEGNTLHIVQAVDDEGNFIEIIATPVNNRTIKGILRYKNPYTTYDGILVMNNLNKN